MIDTCLAPFALRSSQPAIEPIMVTLQGGARDTGLDLGRLIELGRHFERIAPKYREFRDDTKMAVVDTAVLVHQVPGGMISNLVSQLKQAGAINRLQEVFDEIPRTRRELGSPPLVTPTSQMVGVQAAQNVLVGRYKMVSSQVQDYVYGLYGRPPMPIDPEVQKIALKRYKRGNQPITCRPGDVLEPEMEKIRQTAGDLAKDMGEVLICALYPQTGMQFLKWNHGLEPVPKEMKPKTLEDVKNEDEIVAKALASARAGIESE